MYNFTFYYLFFIFYYYYFLLHFKAQTDIKAVTVLFKTNYKVALSGENAIVTQYYYHHFLQLTVVAFFSMFLPPFEVKNSYAECVAGTCRSSSEILGLRLLLSDLYGLFVGFACI